MIRPSQAQRGTGPQLRSAVEERPLSSFAALVLTPGLILAGAYAVAAYRTTGTLGFPLDDAWIHAQFARNLASGAGFTYTDGQWVSGSTAPAWTVLLATTYAITGNMVSAAFLLGATCQVLSGYYAVRLTEQLGAPGPVALLAGGLVVITPVVVWGAVSGMEVSLATTLVLAGLYHHFRARDLATRQGCAGAVLLGASVLARPENLALVAVVLGSDLVGRGRALVRLRRAAGRALVVAVIVAPVVGFSYATLGRPLPSTFYAKSGPGLVRALETRDAAMARRDVLTYGPLAVQNFWLSLLDQFSWAAYLGVLGGLSAIVTRPGRRLALTLAAVMILVPFAMGMTAPQRLKPENVRYVAQLVVLLPPLLVAGAAQALRQRWLVLFVVAAAAGATTWRTADGTSIYARSVKNIEELQVATGRWIADHLPPGAVVAANDVGAIAYFGGRRILDLEGLVSPEVLPYRSLPNRGIHVVTKMRPDYLVIFPGWYPDIVQSGLVQEVHRVSVADNFISAGDTLVVFEMPWTAR